MAASLARIPARGIRRWGQGLAKHRTPWPFPIKRTGLRTLGPYYHEAWEWPMGWSDTDFTELSPQMKTFSFHAGWTASKGHLDYPELENLERVQYPGYKDPVTGEFVLVPEMHAEIVAPDLTGFKLKPYVSYRVEVDIEKAEADGDWPPPPTTPQSLFDTVYKDRVVRSIKDGKYEDPLFSAVREDGNQIEEK